MNEPSKRSIELIECYCCDCDLGEVCVHDDGRENTYNDPRCPKFGNVHNPDGFCEKGKR